jgi:hypothetical protein
MSSSVDTTESPAQKDMSDFRHEILLQNADRDAAAAERDTQRDEKMKADAAERDAQRDARTAERDTKNTERFEFIFARMDAQIDTRNREIADRIAERDLATQEKLESVEASIADTLQKVLSNQKIFDDYRNTEAVSKAGSPQVIVDVIPPSTHSKPILSGDVRNHKHNALDVFDADERDKMFSNISDRSGSDNQDNYDYNQQKPPPKPPHTPKRLSLFDTTVFPQSHMLSDAHNSTQLLVQPAISDLMLDVLSVPKLINFIRDFKRLQQKYITQVLSLGEYLSAAVKDRLIDISTELTDHNLAQYNTVTTFRVPNDVCYDLLVLGVQPRTATRFKLLWSNNLPFPYMHPQYVISITNYSTLYAALCKFRVVINELWGLLTAKESTDIPVLYREGAEPGLFDILMAKIPQDHGVNVLKLIPHKQLKQLTMDDFLICVFAKFKVYKDQSDKNQDHMDNLKLPNNPAFETASVFL